MTALAVRFFPLLARLFAVSLAVFFGLALVISVARVDLGDTVMSLIRWGSSDEGRTYEIMIEVIYLVWAVFLWRAAAAPGRNALFMDFTVAANVAHFGMMAVAGMSMHGEHQHLYGDVLLGWLGLVPFAVVWLLARSTLVARETPVGAV